MSLPQVQAGLDACDKRDAALAIRNLETTHAANAPLHAGKDGSKIYDSCATYLRKIVYPLGNEGPALSPDFDKLREEARAAGVLAPPLKVPERPHLLKLKKPNG